MVSQVIWCRRDLDGVTEVKMMSLKFGWCH